MFPTCRADRFSDIFLLNRNHIAAGEVFVKRCLEFFPREKNPVREAILGKRWQLNLVWWLECKT